MTFPFTPLRWNRFPVRVGRRERSPQRVAAAQRAVKREREAVPLFPELARYTSAEERIQQVEQDINVTFHRLRQFHAQQWREARASLRRLPPITRAGVVQYWNTCGCPGDASYLCSLLRQTRQGLSPWSKLRFRRQLELAGQGKLPFSIVSQCNPES